MYVEEVTIDGFKSYAQRTVVPNFGIRSLSTYLYEALSLSRVNTPAARRPGL